MWGSLILSSDMADKNIFCQYLKRVNKIQTYPFVDYFGFALSRRIFVRKNHNCCHRRKPSWNKFLSCLHELLICNYLLSIPLDWTKRLMNQEFSNSFSTSHHRFELLNDKKLILEILLASISQIERLEKSSFLLIFINICIRTENTRLKICCYARFHLRNC